MGDWQVEGGEGSGLLISEADVIFRRPLKHISKHMQPKQGVPHSNTVIVKHVFPQFTEASSNSNIGLIAI